MSSPALEPRHGEDCACQRCRGFEPGNSAGLRSGAYAILHLGPRIAEIAAELRAFAPAYSPADEPAINLCATCLARAEKGVEALARLDEMAASPLSPFTVDDAAKLQRLREDSRGWINTARRLLNDLGMTPTARAKLGLDIALARRAAISIVDQYRDEDADGRS